MGRERKIKRVVKGREMTHEKKTTERGTLREGQGERDREIGKGREE